MKIKQSVVVKASFNTFSEAERASNSLIDRGLRSYLETSGGPRVVFLVESVNQAIMQSQHLITKPAQVQVFDPNDTPAEGWAQPRVLSLD
jgi:hypothetical protein